MGGEGTGNKSEGEEDKRRREAEMGNGRRRKAGRRKGENARAAWVRKQTKNITRIITTKESRQNATQ